MKFYKDSATGKWMLGTREGIPAGTCLYNYDSATELIAIEYASDRTIFARLPYSEFLKENGDAYASKAEFDLATADFFVKTAGGISSGIEVIDALGYEPLDKQVFEAHKPWATSSHTLSPSKLAGSNASGQAVEIDDNTFALRYSNTPWFNTGTVSSVGTLVTFSGLGGNLSTSINAEEQRPKLTVNGVSRIITNRNNDTQVTIDSAFPSDLVSQAYNVYALEYTINHIFGSGGGLMLNWYDTGRIANRPIFSKGVILYGNNVYDAPLTIIHDKLLATKSIGAVETDLAKIYHTDLNLVRRAFATEDNFVSYQPNPFYSTGTVSVSGTTVTIVGGTFSALMANNSKIRFSNGEERQITAYTDSTHVTINRTTGSTVSGSTFAIYLTRLKDDGTNLIKTDNAGNQTII